MATIKSIEEKARAYDEALERAKEIIKDYESRNLNDIAIYAKEDLTIIFPELRESEDERIKTFIRGLLLPHIADSHIEGDKIVHNKDIDNYRKAHAWLERQGKQKPAEWNEEDEQTFIESVEALEDFGKFELADWLKEHKNKFLSSQSHWKPCEKQIEAIRIAAEVGTANNSWAMNVLKELYEQIKTL